MRSCRHPQRNPWARGFTVLLLLCSCAVPGCEVTPADIQQWKLTEKGPGKLEAALRDKDLPPDLRSQAAVALIEIGRGAVVEDALSGVPEATRHAIVHLSVPRLVTLTQSATPPVRVQGEAKDGLFRLRLLGEPADQDQAELALISWTTAGLAQRMSTGAIGTEQILTGIGRKSQDGLVAVLAGAPIGSPDLLPAASLLHRVGDTAARQRGAEALIRKLPAPGEEPVKNAGAAAQDEVLRALGMLGGPAADIYLMGMFQHGPAAMRDKALAALGQAGDPAALDLALQLAWDRRESPHLREAAFTYLERLGQIAVAGLRRIIADPRDPTSTGEVTRFRAVEAAFQAGGGTAIRGVLEALPTAWAYSREDVTAYIVHQITPLGVSVLPAVRDALHSSSWLTRAAAVLALAEMGQAEDEATLLGLSGDTTPLKGQGWQAATVGELAREQARHIRGKKTR